MAFELKNYQFSLGEHKGKSVIWVQFPNNDTLREELKLAFTTDCSMLYSRYIT